MTPAQSKKNIIISVLMPVRDSARFLSEAIDSIRNQSFVDWELLIADNGSRDSSLVIARSYSNADARIRVFDLPGEILADVRNRLLVECQGEFVAWLDSDDVAEPNRLARQIEFLIQHPDCVIVGSDVLVIDPDGDTIRRECVHYSHEQILSGLLDRRAKGIFFPASAGRRAGLIAAGGFNNKFRCAEDIDLFLRAAESGSLANIPEPLTRYRWRTDSLSWGDADQCNSDFQLAVDDARNRRRLTALPPIEDVCVKKQRHGLGAIYQTWANASLNAGFFSTARKYAFRAILLRPMDGRIWRCLALAVFPLQDDSTRVGLVGVFSQILVSIFRRSLFLIASFCDRASNLVKNIYG